MLLIELESSITVIFDVSGAANIKIKIFWDVISSKGKGKVRPRTGHEGQEVEQMYSSTLPSTSALDRVRWSTPRPGRFNPGKDALPSV